MTSIATSINFNEDTLQKLMSILDDNKDVVKEGDYLKMCNAMMFLHISYKNEQKITNYPQNVAQINPQTSEQQRIIHDYRNRLHWNHYTLRLNALPCKSQRRRHCALLRECEHLSIVIDDVLKIPNITSLTLIEKLLNDRGLSNMRIEAIYLAYRRDERDIQRNRIREEIAWLQNEIARLEALVDIH